MGHATTIALFMSSAAGMLRRHLEIDLGHGRTGTIGTSAQGSNICLTWEREQEGVLLILLH